MQDLNRIPRYNLEHGVENLIKIHQLAHQKPGEIDVEIRTPKVLENLREIAKEYRGAIIHDESIYTLITFPQPLNDTGMIFPKDSESIIEKGVGVVSFREFMADPFQEIPEKKYTKWFDYDKIIESLVLRTRKPGDYLTVNLEEDKKTIKEYMINEKIPKEMRDTIFLFADGSHVLWVIGYRISQHYKVTDQTKRILQIQIEEC